MPTIHHILRGPRVQPKLKVGPANDKYEQEADRVADQVMRMSDSEALLSAALPPSHQATSKTQRICTDCTEELVQTNRSSGDGFSADGPAAAAITTLEGAGKQMPANERAFFEPRFGRSLRDVRIHDNPHAQTAAEMIRARAFAHGRNIAFAEGEYRPGTIEGRRLIAHELTHVVQQGIGRAGSGFVSLARPEDCSKDCDKADGNGTASGKYSITVYADKEGSFLLIPLTSKVGHSWVRLEDNGGRYWTYGFWPQTFFNRANPKADVEGCVHHPDTSHKPTHQQKFELTKQQFEAAKKKATDICKAKPKYNLFGLQCTEFAKRVLAAAGAGTLGGFGLIWESPNALASWIGANALVLGIKVTGATTAAGGAGTGSVAFNLAYRHQFYSVLGNKLRLYGMGQTVLGNRLKTLSAGLGAEVNPQRIWIPRLYLEGSGVVGDLNPRAGVTRAGAGFSTAVGLRYNIDELAMVGIEYNAVKDVARNDPVLQRFMVSFGLRLF
jgi:hypothetical protein